MNKGITFVFFTAIGSEINWVLQTSYIIFKTFNVETVLNSYEYKRNKEMKKIQLILRLYI